MRRLIFLLFIVLFGNTACSIDDNGTCALTSFQKKILLKRMRLPADFVFDAVDTLQITDGVTQEIKKSVFCLKELLLAAKA